MSEKLLYSMGEAAEMLDVAPSVLRFWETKFDTLRPRKNARGARKYTPQDIETLRTIYHLVREQGMTLEGARQRLHAKGDEATQGAKLVENLQRIRALLVEVREQLKEDTKEEEAEYLTPVEAKKEFPDPIPDEEPEVLPLPFTEQTLFEL